MIPDENKQKEFIEKYRSVTGTDGYREPRWMGYIAKLIYKLSCFVKGVKI